MVFPVGEVVDDFTCFWMLVCRSSKKLDYLTEQRRSPSIFQFQLSQSISAEALFAASTTSMSLFLELVLLDQAVRMNLRVVGQILEWKKHLAGHESTCKLNKIIEGHPYFSRAGHSRSLGS